MYCLMHGPSISGNTRRENQHAHERRFQAHLGNVSSIGVNPAVDGGRYLATAGMDGCVKVWDCRNWKGVVREWKVRSGGGGGKHGVAGAELEWSGKGFLAVAAGGAVNVRAFFTFFSFRFVAYASDCIHTGLFTTNNS